MQTTAHTSYKFDLYIMDKVMISSYSVQFTVYGLYSCFMNIVMYTCTINVTFNITIYHQYFLVLCRIPKELISLLKHNT